MLAGRYWKVKNKGREKVHDIMSREATCLPPSLAGQPREAFTVRIRVFEKLAPQGNISGGMNYAEREESLPRILAMHSDVRLKRGMIFILSESEGYRIDTADPPDGITISADALRLTEEEVKEYCEQCS